MISDTLKRENNIDENEVAQKGKELAGKLLVQMRIRKQRN